MSGRTTDVFAAAHANSVFTSQDIRKLDARIRLHNPSGFPALAEEDLERLRSKLNSIGSIYRVQMEVGNMPTPKQALRKMERVERYSVNLLELLGSSPTSSPNEIDMEHIIDGGIFEEPEIRYDSLIESLQEIAHCAGRKVLTLRKSAKSTVKVRDLYRRDLYNDLAMQYRLFWGRDGMGFGVNDASGGGPAVRYLQFTLHKIMRRSISAPAIKTMIAEMKAEHGQAGRYRMFDEPERQKG